MRFYLPYVVRSVRERDAQKPIYARKVGLHIMVCVCELIQRFCGYAERREEKNVLEQF